MHQRQPVGVPTTALKENLLEKLRENLQEDVTMGASKSGADPHVTSSGRAAVPSTNAAAPSAGTAAPSRLQKNFTMWDGSTRRDPAEDPPERRARINAVDDESDDEPLQDDDQFTEKDELTITAEEIKAAESKELARMVEFGLCEV